MDQKLLSILAILLFCSILTGIAVAGSTSGDASTNSTNQSTKATIISFTPTSGKLGETVAFNITGSGFDKSAKVYLKRILTTNLKKVEGKNLSVNSDSHINGTFKIPADYVPGEWEIIVEQKDQTSKFGEKFIIER
jgi:hypothetical protein